MSNTKITSVECVKCARLTRHETIHEHSYTYSIYPDDDYPNGYSVEFEQKYRIVRCCGCHTVSFQELLWESETHESTETLYPSRTAGRQPISAISHFPAKVRRIYLETLIAFNNNAPTLAAVGLRASVEAICLEQGCTARSLPDKISALVNNDLLTKRQAEFLLHIHKPFGDEAAHKITPPLSEELIAALDILETLLKTVYELPVTAANVRQSKNKRAATRAEKAVNFKE